jgi:hypothetical protein
VLVHAVGSGRKMVQKPFGRASQIPRLLRP